MDKWSKYEHVNNGDHKNNYMKEFYGTNGTITIQEKLDGANASFQVHEGKLIMHSRNKLLEGGGLRGFWSYINERVNPLLVPDGLIFYGEWLVPHKVKYPDKFTGEFYLFDVWDIKQDRWIIQSVVELLAESIGINYIKPLYVGKPLPLSGILYYVGHTDYEGNFNGKITGEGIVVKEDGSHPDILCRENRNILKFKIDDFDSGGGKKVKSKSNLTERELIALDFVHEYVTESRIEGIVLKLIDEGILSESHSIKDMGVALRHVHRLLMDDIQRCDGHTEDAIAQMAKDNARELNNSIKYHIPLIVKKIMTK